MHDSMELIREINTLPIEERAFIADSVLKSLNNNDSEINNKWKDVAERRLDEIISGKVKPIGGNKVILNAQQRLEK